MEHPIAHTEQELLHLTGEGDECAFSSLFDLYRNKIFTVAYKLTASEENAEEIVQDVFLKVWLKRQSLKQVDNFNAWLFIIARNTVYSFLRSKAAKTLHASLQEADIIGIPDEATRRLQEKEFQTLLREAVNKLPKQQKEVYLLSSQYGLKYEEIARQLGIAPETARKHLQFAIKCIRAFLLSRVDMSLLLIILWKTS